jgi:2-haloacid dehalogenase
MIKAAVFDVGRVLFEWDLGALMSKLYADRQELAFVLENVITEAWHFEHDAGRDLQDMVAQRKAQFPEYAKAIEAYAARFSETIPGPVAGSHEIVAELKERGIPLFAITNFAATFWDEFRANQPIFDGFANIIVSGKEALVKPDPAIYALAEARFGYSAKEMIFIDDNRANIEAAAALGWRTHHFADADLLRADLVELGLLEAGEARSA